MHPLPTLVVVSGPAGSGKTTLAHAIASAVGCPAICRDEIKEGMVHATWGPAASGFVAQPGDELTARTLPVFFAVLEVLLRAGVTTVAEAAFQDHVWRPRLAPLLGLARLRIVHCTVDPGLACQRVLRRAQDNPLRRAHADLDPANPGLPGHPGRPAFVRIALTAPSLEVDTTDGYRPALDQIVAFVNAPA
jgi:predicted kinase